ncbi:hypothetical protein EAF04_005125 [Stromatinia cepivora]|nr:hypothetical protein EAF04_005125 [Stromatinia cepivora]
MSTSSRPCTFHHVRFGPNVTNPSGKELQVIRNSVKKQYYHRMVDSEKKLWIQANIKAQIELEVSDEKPQGAQRRILFEDNVTTPPCEGVALETKLWNERNTQIPIGAKVLGQKQPDMQRRVRFRDSFPHTPLNSIGVPRSSAKKQYYNRMVQLEANIWLEGKNKDREADEWSGGDLPVGTKYHQLRDGAGVSGGGGSKATDPADAAIKFSKDHGEMVHNVTIDRKSFDMTSSAANDDTFVIVSKS